jgi:hypothetical protein
MTPQETLRHHVTGAIERGETEAVLEATLDFWNRWCPDRATAQLKHDAALVALTETRAEQSREGLHRVWRGALAEEALSRAAWVGYWKLQLEKMA